MNTWWHKAVFYEVYIDKFAGDFNKMTGKLDYLSELGVGCVHILPFFPSGGVDGGYDVIDYRGVDSRFGSLRDVEIFIKEADRRGIKVMVDLVLNHTSTKHPWFQEALKSPDSDKHNFYLWSDSGEEFSKAYNPFKHMKPKNWIYDEAAEGYYFSTFYPGQADLNWDNPSVEKEFIDIINFWANVGVRGFRLDAVPHLIKREDSDSRNLPEVHRILKRLRASIDQTYGGDVILLAEVQSSVEVVKSYFGNGDECHMAYNFPLMQNIYLSLVRDDPSIIRKKIRELQSIPDSCQWVNFIENHDKLSFGVMDQDERKEIIKELDPENKYSFRLGKSVAMRAATALNGDRSKLLRAYEIIFCSGGCPVIYSGGELGAENTKPDSSMVDTRWYVRGEFDWDEATRQKKDPESILNSVSRLIRDYNDENLTCDLLLKS